jgi:hypothetical protein
MGISIWCSRDRHHPIREEPGLVINTNHIYSMSPNITAADYPWRGSLDLPYLKDRFFDALPVPE